jgi:hypothetical protein
MKTGDFRKLIKMHLAPALEEQGFIGSDHHFVKDNNNHVINTIVIQADKYGGSCIVELGVHLDFLPNLTGEFIPSHKLTVYDCEFRKRLVNEINWFQKNILREKEREVWFKYGDTEDESLSVIENIKEMLLSQGLRYLSQFNDFPYAITSIQLDELF